MFNTIAGIPAHPLFVHLSVVAIPVAAVLALIWAARPHMRALGTTTTTLSLVSIASAFISRASGEALMEAQGLTEANPGELGPHLFYANLLTGSIIVMAALAVVFWLMNRSSKASPALKVVMRILIVLAAIAVIITCVLTGHAGAAAVWTE